MDSSPPSDALRQFAHLAQRLDDAVLLLGSATTGFQLAPVEDREWFALLRRKLLPQLGGGGFLVTAVVGGTNIGKSVVFNHLAGGEVSAVSPLASGTRHPTAILCPQLAERIDLQKLFPGFDVRPATDPHAALQESAEHLLYFRIDDRCPETLLILDTPDVDSVARVNWERAGSIRQSADVLLAVLTQQKYNDAAVKEFFRLAAQEGKQVIVLFNQVQLPEDEEYWPLWLETFCSETGVRPELVYLAPYDRRAAQELRLPFYERSTTDPAAAQTPRSLMRDLADLRFGEIKIRALRGALSQVADRTSGVPGWLAEIRVRSGEFQNALDLMTSRKLVEVSRWPTLPNSVLIEQIRRWWADQREGWTAAVHGFYGKLGGWLAQPVRMLRERTTGPVVDPVQTYREAEWGAVLEVLEASLERLTWLRDLGHPLLEPRLREMLGGSSREELISRIRAAHDQIDFTAEVRRLVNEQLQSFRLESESSYRLFRRLDSVAAAARPAVSVVLFLTGAGPLGHALAPAAADAAVQGLLHVAGDAVGGTVVTAVGDKLLTDTASTSAGYLEARFRQLHATFAQQRTAWMARQLEEHLLQSLPRELAQGADVVRSPEFQQVRRLAEELEQMLGSQPQFESAQSHPA